MYENERARAGIDFAYIKNSHVYHTRFDDAHMIALESIALAGSNMLAFMRNLLNNTHLDVRTRSIPPPATRYPLPARRHALLSHSLLCLQSTLYALDSPTVSLTFPRSLLYLDTLHLRVRALTAMCSTQVNEAVHSNLLVRL